MKRSSMRRIKFPLSRLKEGSIRRGPYLTYMNSSMRRTTRHRSYLLDPRPPRQNLDKLGLLEIGIQMFDDIVICFLSSTRRLA